MRLRSVVALVVVITSCSSPKANLAIEQVTAIEPDARCVSVYVDVGDAHVHSARCRLPSKAVVYCRISTADPLKCDTLMNAPGAPAAPAEPPRKAEPAASSSSPGPGGGAPHTNPAPPPSAETTPSPPAPEKSP